MGVQKNKYRRNLIFVLLFLNIMLILSLYVFYVKA